MATEQLQTAIASTRAILAATTAEQLDQPTPCSSWKVRDIINHVIQRDSAGARNMGVA